MRRDCKCIRFEDGTAGFVCTEMEGNSLNVSVTQDFTCAWSGSGSLEDLNKIDKLDMRQVTDEALLRIPSTRTFMYALGCSEKESAVFKWKLSQGNVKFIIGSLKLKSVPVREVLETMLNTCATQDESLRQEVHNHEMQHKHLSDEHEKTTEVLNKYERQLDTLRKDLLDRCLSILNSKKEVIKCLSRDMNDEEGEGRGQDSGEQRIPSPQPGPSTSTKFQNCDNSLFDEDTDVESDSENSLRKPVKNMPHPRSHINYDDSDDEEPSHSPPKRTKGVEQPSQVQQLMDTLIGDI